MFAHPVSSNISLHEAETVFKEMGAELSNSHSGKLHVKLNGHSANFGHANHSLPKNEVTQMRKFIETCGIDPEKDYPL